MEHSTDREEVAVKVLVCRTGNGPRHPLPTYATPGSAGLDLRAVLESELILAPGRRALVGTGLSVALPEGYEAQIRPRSGLAVRHGVTLLNSPGTIDSDYRGEIRLVMVNLGQEPFTVHSGDRIGQMVVSRVTRARLEEVEVLPATRRDAGGFGHTGTK